MTDTYPGLAYQTATLPCLPVFADYEVQADLAGTIYRLRFSYNRRGEFWALSIYDADGTPRIHGRKMVQGWSPTDKIPQARPALCSLLVDGDEDVPLGQDALGDTFLPTYITLIREEDA